MRPEIAEADRRFAVRRAVASWQRAGAIGPEARREIDGLHADHRRRTGGWFRLLLFVFGVIGAQGVFGLFSLVLAAASLPPLAWAGVLLALAGALVAATELLLGPLRLRRFGVEEATGWVAVGAATSGIALALGEIGGGLGGTLVVGLAAALLAGAAAWRWGLPLT
ncbi:MAG TPA: hypothetical protein VHM02_04810, partial [Thermoanaerobaculia bacterium]|nr:hypothetical protein [Thermoanaerobaculia bacterium]